MPTPGTKVTRVSKHTPEPRETSAGRGRDPKAQSLRLPLGGQTHGKAGGQQWFLLCKVELLAGAFVRHPGAWATGTCMTSPRER